MHVPSVHQAVTCCARSQMFDGDLHVGLAYVVHLFEVETRELLDYVHLETRLLFGIYIAFVSNPDCDDDGDDNDCADDGDDDMVQWSNGASTMRRQMRTLTRCGCVGSCCLSSTPRSS
eukprot:1097482-Rhodomonas_salina.1